MKINFDSIIKNLRNEEMKSSIDGRDTPLTLKEISVNALLGDIPPTQGEKPDSGQQKLQKFKLAQKIDAGGEIDLVAEDVSMIKERIGKAYSTLIVGRAYELLERPKE